MGVLAGLILRVAGRPRPAEWVPPQGRPIVSTSGEGISRRSVRRATPGRYPRVEYNIYIYIYRYIYIYS